MGVLLRSGDWILPGNGEPAATRGEDEGRDRMGWLESRWMKGKVVKIPKF